MRVLHIQKVKGVGGSERHLLSLMPSLRDAGLDARIIVIASEAADGFISAMRDHSVPLEVVPWRGFADPTLAAQLTRKVRAMGPDVVHTHLIHADCMVQPIASFLGCKRVSTMHSAHAFYGREPYKVAARLVGRLSHRTIAISEHVARYAERLKLTPSRRIRVVPYGIEASLWASTDENRGIDRTSLALQPSELVVGVASRLIPGKGHALAIAALASASATEPSLRLVIAGDGPLRSELETYADRVAPGLVRFVGHLSDMRRFMSACDFVCFPTLPALSEGFGLAALEAMAAGRPVVAVDTGPLPEVVDDGVTGLLVPPRVADLREAFLELAGSSTVRAEMGRAALLRASTRFNLEKMTQATLDVYEELGKP